MGGLVLKAVCTYIQVYGRDSFSKVGGGVKGSILDFAALDALGGCNIQPATFY